MDPLSAFGLACNVMQAVDFGLKAIKTFKELSTTGNTSANQDIIERSQGIEKASQGIRNILHHYHATPKPLTATETTLQEIADRCIHSAEALQKKLKPLDKDQNGRKRAILRAGLATLFGRNELKEIEARMRGYEQSLQMHVLVHLNAKQELESLEHQDRLKDIDETLAEFIRRLAEGHADTQHLVQEQGNMVRQVVVQQGQETINYIREEFQTRRVEDINSVQHQSLLNSLWYPEMNARRNQITESHKSTFQWIYNQNRACWWSSFTQFLQSSGNIYWIRGKAGSGKSCLMKFLSTDPRTICALQRWRPECSIKVLSHFCWSSGSEIQKSLKGLMLSIVHQVLSGQPDLASKLVAENPRLSEYNNIDDWSNNELLVIFKQLAALEHSTTICLFFDGLDEIDQDHSRLGIITFIEDLSSLDNVKLCLSSRPELELTICLESYPHLKLEALTRRDIETLARDILLEASRKHPGCLPPENLNELVRTTVEKAEGIFLWAAYALKSLCKGLLGRDSFKLLHVRLEQLPKGVENLYRTMWKRLNEDEVLYREDAAWYFHFALESRRYFGQWQHLVALTLARKPALRKKILDDVAYNDADFDKHCLETEHLLTVRCAGLLEVERWLDVKTLITCGTDETDDNSDHRHPGAGPSTHIYISEDQECERSIYENKVMGRVDFIHRSAQEFLCETRDGKEILGHLRMNAREILSMQIETQIALLVVRPPGEHITSSLETFLLEDMQHFHDIVGCEPEALGAVSKFIHVCRTLCKEATKHSPFFISGRKTQAFALTDCGVLASFSQRSAIEIIGLLVEETPKIETLNFSLIEKYIKGRQMSTTFATYLLMCAAANAVVKTISSTYRMVFKISDATYRLLRLLLECGADPNAKYPLPQTAHEHCTGVSFIDIVSGWLQCGRLSRLSLKRLVELLEGFGWDLQQSTWLQISPFHPRTFLSRWFYQITPKCLIFSLDMPDSKGFVYSAEDETLDLFLGMQEGHTDILPLFKAAYILDGDEQIYSRVRQVGKFQWFSAHKVVDKDSSLLVSAIIQFQHVVDEEAIKGSNWDNCDSSLWREERMRFWDSTVGPAIEGVKSRCQAFHGDEEVSAELIRAGILISKDNVDTEGWRNAILMESDRIAREGLTSHNDWPVPKKER